MLIVNKLGSAGEIKKVVLRKSRTEVHLVDGRELHYYTNEAYNKEDDLSVFATLMRNKFLDGRDRHFAQGSPKYKGDTIWELQGELLDMASYSSVLHTYLSRLKESAREVLKRVLKVEKSSEEEGSMIVFRVETDLVDNLVSDLEAIAGKK